MVCHFLIVKHPTSSQAISFAWLLTKNDTQVLLSENGNKIKTNHQKYYEDNKDMINVKGRKYYLENTNEINVKSRKV